MKLWQRLSVWAVSLTALLAGTVAVAAPVGAQGTLDVCNQPGASSSAVCQSSGENNISGPNGIIVKVSNIFAFAGGVAAILIILIGGFIMITAGGDANKAHSGRSAIIYAAVGLVVIVLGRTIIGFVINRFR